MDDAAAGESRVEDLVSMITRRNAALREAQRCVSELRGKGEAADGRVTVEVDRFGALAGLRIDPRAMRLGSEALSEAILDAAAQGVREVWARAGELMRPLVAELTDARPRAGTVDFGEQDFDDVLAAMRGVRFDPRT